MNTLADKRRLAQAQRITDVKRRRAERERVEAKRIEREAQERAEAAHAQRGEAQEQRAQARSAFFKHNGDPQAEVWLIASEMREKHAISEVCIAQDKSATAITQATAARREHERLHERAALMDTRMIAITRDIANRVQNREDEDMQERSR
ncbi:MAG: hypothetical protein WBA51_12685 [Erythrobacter sp.]